MLEEAVETFLHCWWECKLVQPLRKTARRLLRKLKTELPYDPAISHPGTHLTNYNPKRYMHPRVQSSTIHESQDNLQYPMTHEQIKKMQYAYMQWTTMQAQEIRNLTIYNN